ncbi:ATP-binding cassette domain-containing protein [Mycoplasmatota bacterium]|nr:ATP-binding cassette domain-containing protein [Mycoplasmatota bacterium]
MLELKNIKKDYYVAGKPVPALKGINLVFKDQEFVSILGPSGCGKTTMLNLIGGLDRYTSGDLLIDGKSTRDYKDQDWDAYRNATIGFVFQTYNLISHLSVLDNVEMALRLSGVEPKERKERATKALVDVGLQDHLTKRPNQLSGGQMQRVAIARALVNNPKILLADEPTGALDSKTSDQIMKLMKEIAKDRLVIMVTHNKDIADEFSDRVVNLLDGLVIDDSNPSENNDGKDVVGKLVNKKTSMPYLTALSTSFKNLLTKKGRTLITALAGSIGIIGIALVLSVSSGMTAYVDELQSDTLAGFPLTIEQYYVDFAEVGQERLSEEGYFPEGEDIVGYDPQSDFITHANIITDDFITYLEDLDETTYNSISYTSSMHLNIAAEGTKDNDELLEDDFYSQLPNNEEFILSQYDVIKGDLATSMNEVVIVVDAKNRLDFDFMEALGLSIDGSYTFDDLIGLELKVFPNNLYYSESGGIYSGNNNISSIYDDSDAMTLTVSGIIRVNEDASTDLVASGIAYTEALTDYMLEDSMDSDVVAAQLLSPTVSIVSGYNIYEVLLAIGGTDVPASIQIYPVSFDAKEEIKDYIDAYNETVDETYAIYATDLAAIISTSISSLISTITIILSAFAGISLVVSSIMIGIITYVSVVERTKEIGIMRSLGARKKDISRIFNAETVLIGFTSGLLGVIITLVLIIPINLILANLLDVSGFAQLMWSSAIGLIVLSTFLTLIAGLIPSRIAARKDPVTALRTE